MAKPLYIAGDWVETERLRESRAPGDGRLLDQICLAGPEEVERAAAAAHAARGALAALSGGERAELLRRLADRVEAARDELANLIMTEAGKPLPFALGEVSRGLQTLQIAAEEAVRIEGEVIPLDRTEKGRDRIGISRRFPAGPVLGITPFNFPLNLALHKLAPALAAGCPIVLKAADQTPLVLLRLAELFDELGAPRGALSVINAETQHAELLVRDERFAVLSFTGSPQIGFLLKSICGRKKVVLELGGNAAVYVDRGADLERAAERIAFGALAYSGQVCISVQRIYAHAEVYEELRDLLVERFRAAEAGPPDQEGVTVVPLIDEGAAERVADLVEAACAAGATRLVGGPREGSLVPATLLADVPAGADAKRREAFGPLATLESVASAAEAFAAINDSEFGLQAGVFSDDLQVVLAAHEALEVGGVLHDEVPTWRVDEMPYGGVKASGLGREGLRAAIRDLTEPRLLILRQRPL
jgi:acyl-CoA reductase-like NAD-dependent aldehyde dehydrogenase